MAGRISKKEKERRAKISASLKKHYQSKREEFLKRSKAAKKGAKTKRAKKKAEGAPYHKPPKTRPEPIKIKVGHGAKKKAVYPTKPKKKPIPEPEPSVVLPERKKKRVKKKPSIAPPEPPPAPPVKAPPPPESFSIEAASETGDTWNGPWREQPPSDAQVAEAVSEIVRISEAIVDGISSDRVADELGLKDVVRAWALRPVINSDLTVSGEVRFDVPRGVEPATLAQYLDGLLPVTFIDNLWVIPVIAYEPLASAGDVGMDKLSNSPFEPIRGMAEVRSFAIKYDERIGVKTVTGYLRGQEVAQNTDPDGRFIRPSYVRVKLRWAERPPRSAYEIRKMEENRRRKEASDRFVKMQGFEPL